MLQRLAQIPNSAVNWTLEYLGFFRASVAEFSMDVWRHKAAKAGRAILWIAVGIAAKFVSDWLGIPWKDIVVPIYRLLLPAWWVVIALGLVVIGLLAVINGSRKYHERIVKEIFEVDEDLRVAQKDNSAYAERIARLYGVALALWGYLDRQEILKTEQALPVMDIQYFEIDLRNQLNTIEPQLGDKTLESMGKIPDEWLAQKMRFYEHRDKLEAYLAFYMKKREEIFDEAETQRLATLERSNTATKA
jgi:hypothetical protein